MTEWWAPGTFIDRLAPDSRARLLSLGTVRRLDAGRRLMREGDRTTHVEVLLHGYVKVTTDAEGVEALLAIRVAGDVVGETPTLTGNVRNATVTTCGRVTAAVVSGDKFRQFLRECPDAALSIAASMGDQLRWANQRRIDFAAYAAEVRLARILVELAALCGRQTGDGVAFGVTISQPELASMIGVAEPTVQKAVRYLRDAGLIRSGYRQVTIVDLDGLRGVGRTVGKGAAP